MPFKKGQSGNPNGRPPKTKNKIPSNKALRESLKKSCPEALNTTLAYMREYRCDANTAKRRAAEILNELPLTEDPFEIEKLTTELRNCLKDKDSAFDKTLKASFKLMDATYTMVATEDRLEMTKKENNADTEEDEEDDLPAPVLQLSAVKK